MLTITTDSFAGYGLDRIFQIVSEAKFDGIEVCVRHDDYDTQDADYLKTLSKRYDLPIVAIAAPINISPQKAENSIDLALAVGAPVVTITPPDLFDFHYKKWIREQMRGIRKKKKIHIALTNASAQTVLGILPKYSLNDINELRNFPDIALDTSNVASKSEPLLEIYSALKQNIVHIYFSNTNNEHGHTLPTDGNLPLESLLTRLVRDNYKGVISLRLNPHALGVGSLEKIAENIKKCQEFVKKYYQAK